MTNLDNNSGAAGSSGTNGATTATGASTWASSRAPTREAAGRHLRALVGRDDAVLRDDQWTAIEALVVDRRRALVVQRTGWGKSAVYFVATALLRELGSGPTVIISPLLALMRNQIAAAERAGITAVTINSTNIEQWQDVHAAVAAGEIDVLLVSPERLNNPGFRDEVLPGLAATAGLLVVDEAHCISDWGHDFRPDYRRLRTLLAELPTGIPVLATTATANERVTDDVAAQLGDDVLVLRGSLDRESLRLGVVRLPTAAQRLGWLADHLDDQPGSGIIYCLTVAATQEVAGFLAGRGHRVAAYSGQTDPTERLVLEDDLLSGRVKALVATSALGMGFDATLGFVVNLGAPASPVAYYQQVGRAGRGIDEATVVLLPAIEDQDIWAYFAGLAFPPEPVVRQTLDALSQVHAETGRPVSTPALEVRVELNRNRLDTMLKVLDVDGAVRRVKGGWEPTGLDWSYDRERYDALARARRQEQEAMLAYLSTDECRMWFLRNQLDDAAVSRGQDKGDGEDRRCGRCDNCGGLQLSTSTSSAAVHEAATRLARPGVVIEPRKMWPQALPTIGIPLKGRIADPPEQGRAIARLTDLGFGQQLRELFRDETPDGPVPTSLARAMVEVLGDWRPSVDAVVVVDSTRRRGLVDDLAAGLSRYLRVPITGRFEIVDPEVPPGRGAVNSAQRVAAVRQRFAFCGEAAGSVLIVDDRIGTGWTMTLAAAAVRAAGASQMFPLALALES